tara:strand:+ start:11452 stop:11697 length:246 start_codon:yes stop_codon:yes gene_type:complete
MIARINRMALLTIVTLLVGFIIFSLGRFFGEAFLLNRGTFFATVVLPVTGWAFVGWVVARALQTRYRLDRLETQVTAEITE